MSSVSDVAFAMIAILQAISVTSRITTALHHANMTAAAAAISATSAAAAAPSPRRARAAAVGRSSSVGTPSTRCQKPIFGFGARTVARSSGRAASATAAAAGAPVMEECDVAVIGAGPGGLATALALQAAGRAAESSFL